MYNVSNNDANGSPEFAILETLINEQNRNSDQPDIPVNAIRNLKKYVQADDVLLILFDAENPGWASKKWLGMEEAWSAESAFPLNENILGTSIPQDILCIDYGSETDPVLFGETTVPVQKVILAPLALNQSNFGAMVFIKPGREFSHPQQFKFLQLLVKGLANNIHIAARTRQLIVNNADLEATYLQTLN